MTFLSTSSIQTAGLCARGQFKVMGLASDLGTSLAQNLPIQTIPRERGLICSFHKGSMVSGWREREKQELQALCPKRHLAIC